jgi:hypothetical protein
LEVEFSESWWQLLWVHLSEVLGKISHVSELFLDFIEVNFFK